MPVKVGDVMVKRVIVINADVNVKEAAKVMNDNEIGSLIVVEEDKAVGILTERDLLKKIVATAADPEKVKVRDIMSSPLVVVDPDANLEDAIRLMFEVKVKRLPVVKHGQLVGLLSLTDACRLQPQMIQLVKELAAKCLDLPKRMQKTVKYYIA